MRIITEEGKQEMVFRRDNDKGYASYSISINKKTDEGYERSYFPVKFRKGTDLANQTKIVIKDAFMTFDKWTDSEGKTKTNNYLFIMDFDTVGGIEKQEKPKTKSVWEEFGEELDDSMLPF